MTDTLQVKKIEFGRVLADLCSITRVFVQNAQKCPTLFKLKNMICSKKSYNVVMVMTKYSSPKGRGFEHRGLSVHARCKNILEQRPVVCQA